VPFTGRNEFQVLARHLNEPPIRPRVLVPTLPEAAESVLLTMLAKRPELRFETMGDVEQALVAIPEVGSVVVSRHENSGPLVVRRRESSGPGSQASPRGRVLTSRVTRVAPTMAQAEQTGPPRTPTELVPPPGVPDHWPTSDSVELFTGMLDDEPRRREWGRIVTVVLLALLSVVGIASVVLRQQGIELRWPWSVQPQEAAPPRG